MIKSSDQGAFEALYYRYFTQLCQTAFSRIHDEKIVEELVQDVFINLWAKRTGLDESGNVAAYLFATLRNKVLHQLRAELIINRHRQQLLQLADVAHADDLHSYISARDIENKIKTAVFTLPPQCREAFTLSRFEHLPYKLIAERMNISVNTVEKHIGKALHILREELKKHEIPLVLCLGIQLVTHLSNA